MTAADPATLGADPARLWPYLAPRLQLAGGPDQLTVDLLAGGKSNLTFAVSGGDRSWVLRRPPLGRTLATAHDMAREHRVLTALRDTAVPVPTVEFLCEDTDIIGAPFYVMARMPGRAVRDPGELARLGPDGVRAVADRLIDILADLHAVDPVSVGLADFGRPDGYNERQLKRWTTQMTASMTGEIPGLDALLARLAAEVPPSPAPAIVHGDFRLDNVLLTGLEPSNGPVDGGGPVTVTAVLDWEMSTLGDPLGDLALTLLYAGRALPDVTTGTGGRAAVDVPGHPSAADLVQRYSSRTGRDVPALQWYSAFARFKLAAIAQGVHHRYLGGGYGDLPGFAEIGGVVAPLIDEARQILDSPDGVEP